MSTAENLGFTDRCIAKLQAMSIKDGPFVAALNAYLVRHGRLVYDIEHNLFLVTPPSGQLQVAVWMMPVCADVERRASCQAL